MRKGFTLVELLVVMAVLSFFGILILVIFTRTLKGGNKAQMIGVIKQNGQAVLEVMDKTIREADRVVCVNNNDIAAHGKTIVVIRDGNYTRYRFIKPAPDPNPTANGTIQQDVFTLPSTPPPGSNPDYYYIRDFERLLCDVPSEGAQNITDNNSQTGVSVISASFTNPVNGYKDTAEIEFKIGPGVKAARAIADQVDPVTFQTTVQLR